MQECHFRPDFFFHRLYIQNLPEKLQKHDLRRELYMLFSTYGSVLSLVALKTPKMRGQAHVTFKDVQTATQAMRNVDGFEFFGRPMVRIVLTFFSQTEKC